MIGGEFWCYDDFWWRFCSRHLQLCLTQSLSSIFYRSTLEGLRLCVYTLTPHLVAGAFEDKVALLDEVKGELEVQVGALAQGLEVGAELAEGGVVHLAVERDVVLDLGAAVDAVQDVALQVLVDGVVLLQGVQRDVVERQLVGDLLRRNVGQNSGREATWGSGFQRRGCSRLYLQGGSDGDHQFEPRREPVDGFGEEGHDGVAVVGLVELCLVQPVDEDDEVLVRVDLPL